jgi:hypothetical protein
MCATVPSKSKTVFGIDKTLRHRTAAYLNWVPCQASGWRVVVVGGVVIGSVDARPYLGLRPGRGR